MADTDTETLPNGTAALSEEDERLKQRPADIDADVREMERRKRVEALMSSKLFREELERVLDQQIHEGNDAPLLQRIREMVGGRLHTGSFRGPSCVLPINDIRGIEGVGYEKGEKILRCKLAAVYRLVDLFGWTQTGISGQITARLNTAVEQVLTTPRGLLPHEVTASSLVKVDMQGQVQDQGTTNFPVNVEGFSLHASVHAARPDVRCVLHIRSPSALAVSSMKRGLLPLCNEAALLGDIAYHRVPYGNLDNEERDKLLLALGPHAKVLMISSGGALCCGATLEEAFYQARNLTAACDVQLRLASLPLDELSVLDEETRKQIYDCSRAPPTDAVKWRVGGEEFEALMRMLDNAGFRTGYIYRHPLVKNDVPKPKNDVEVPPAVSSLGYLLEEEELYRQGIWKKGQGTKGERTRWLNSPNVYQKVEVLETGTTDPKKITKWVDSNNEEWIQDGSPANSGTPVKIDTLQFVPKNTNPKEFKALQQQIKDYRRADKISAGPQSHILEGVTWDEASQLVGEDAANTHTGDHVVLMGAASKGIIQRGYQHNATMYSAPYARNPFDHVTDSDIDEYRRTVARKQRNDYDTDLSESEAISAAQITSPASAPSETEEESRDEHRVLRIETKQAPIRSQPEVVLSDVDATEFLNAERAHADRTKVEQFPKQPERDPNLLSDDEVFLDMSAASTTSGVMSGMSSGVTSPVPAQTVLIREQQTAVQQTVGRGTKLTPDCISCTDALSTSKRSIHDYSRTNNFNYVVKQFDSTDNDAVDTKKQHPKCKLSLNTRLETKFDAVDTNQGNSSSRSSLRSIASIEWDGRCRSEYIARTQSLPRQRPKNTINKLYRTRSHSGFNSQIKNPDPVHYHLPKCRSCGAANPSYSWELTKEEKLKQKPTSIYYSVDNIPQACIEDDFNKVKVIENEVPVFKIEKADVEFVHSQEFNEDNYLEVGNSFSSNNQTVIEKGVDESDTTEGTLKDDDDTAILVPTNSVEDLYRAECVLVNNGDDHNNTESTEGEYHSFTDDMYFEVTPYESPVKDLVEKDIRDYSVPIGFYCDDYAKNGSPVKSPLKRRENELPNLLEPILEESKSSYGDDSSNSGDKVEVSKELNDNDDREDIDKDCVVKTNDNTNLDVDLDVGDLNPKPINLKLNEDTEILDNETVMNGQGDANGNLADLVSAYVGNETETSKVTDEDPNTIVTDVVQDIFTRALTAAELKIEIGETTERVTTELLEREFKHKLDSSFIVEEDSDVTTKDVDRISVNAVKTAVDVYSEVEERLDQQEIVDSVYENVFEILSNDAIRTKTLKDISEIDNDRSDVEVKGKGDCDNILSLELVLQKNDNRSSVYSIASSGVEIHSFDSTVEFEKYELITDVVSKILDRIDFDNDHCDTINRLPKDRKVASYFEVQVPREQFATIDEAELEDSFQSKEQTDTESDSRSDSDGFSITRIVQDIEQNIHLNDTILTEVSDTDLLSNKIVEGILYFVLNKVYFTLTEKDKLTRRKTVKKVITIADSEDILFTAISLWPDSDSVYGLDHFEDEIKFPKDDNIANPAEDLETCLNSDTIGERIVNSIDKVTIKQIYDSKEFEGGNSNITHIATLKGKLKDQFLPLDTVVDDKTTFEQRTASINVVEPFTDNNMSNPITFDSFRERSDNEADSEFNIKGNGDKASCDNIDATDTLLCDVSYEIAAEVIETSCDINYLGDIEDNTAGETSISTYYVEKRHNITYSEVSYEIAAELVSDILQRSLEIDYVGIVENDLEQKSNATYSIEKSCYFRYDSDEAVVVSDNSETDINETYYHTLPEVQARRTAAIENFMNEAFIPKEDMNTAFVESPNDYSRSFSPQYVTFDKCDESPIKNPDNTFIGDDLSVLYEKDDTILGSPFIKKAPVISMSQNEHSGGIKYWLSFDESLNESVHKPEYRPIRQLESNVPSFLSVNFNDSSEDFDHENDWDITNNNIRRSSVLLDDLKPNAKVNGFVEAGVSKSSDFDDSNAERKLLYDSKLELLLDDLKPEANDGFVKASVSESSDFDDSNAERKLLYDSRLELHSSVRRQHHSWPPFEDTLFYRIISKFRMSESFDPSEFERLQIDNSS